MSKFFDWFAGGTEYQYHNLFHCLDGDLLTISMVLLLCIGVFTGYFVIAWRWSVAAIASPDSDAKKALQDLKWIFIFCSVCGYAWVCMEALWPAWRLYIIFLVFLNFFTWRYVLRIHALEGVYKHLRDKDQYIQEIELQRVEIESLKKQLREKQAATL